MQDKQAMRRVFYNIRFIKINDLGGTLLPYFIRRRILGCDPKPGSM